jgi:hypothetical protein
MGFLNPFIYQHPEAFNDVTTGRNGGTMDPQAALGYPALQGWYARCVLSVTAVLLLACMLPVAVVLMLACYQLLSCCCWHVISYCRAAVGMLLTSSYCGAGAAVGMLSVAAVLSLRACCC